MLETEKEQATKGETVIERERAKRDKINWDYLAESGLLTALSGFWEETNGAYNFTVWEDHLFLFLQSFDWINWHFEFIPDSVNTSEKKNASFFLYICVKQLAFLSFSYSSYLGWTLIVGLIFNLYWVSVLPKGKIWSSPEIFSPWTSG